MVEFNRDKTWVYFEDNGDGTITLTLNIPEDGVYGQSAVLELGIEEIAVMSQNVAPEIRDNIAENLTIIPNSPEEV